MIFRTFSAQFNWLVRLTRGDAPRAARACPWLLYLAPSALRRQLRSISNRSFPSLSYSSTAADTKNRNFFKIRSSVAMLAFARPR